MTMWRAVLRWAVVVGAVGLAGCYAGPDFVDRGPGGPPLPTVGPDDFAFRETPTSTRYLPAPLSGGSLTLLDAATALVADADRERLWKVDLVSGAVSMVQFAPGSRPRRSVVQADGMVAVLLRGSGQVAVVDPAAMQPGAPRGPLRLVDACLEPRDLAVDPSDRALLVSCRDGALVRLSDTGRTETRLADDLRDLVVDEHGLAFTSSFLHPGLSSKQTAVTQAPRAPAGTEASVAWRTVASPVGPVMLHQLASTSSIAVATAATTTTTTSPYGSGAGGGPGCSGSIVTSALTFFPAGQGDAPRTVQVGDILGMDLAVRQLADGALLVAVAGVSGPGVSVYLINPRDPNRPDNLCGQQVFTLFGQFTGVRFAPGGGLVAHLRSSSQVAVVDPASLPERLGGFGGMPQVRFLSYAPDSVDSNGSQLFHLAPSVSNFSGAALACASCHPEATEDGHTWIINGQPRRTQNLAGGVTHRAPFHWVGDLPTVGALLGDTFTRRMGGGTAPPAFVASLGQFLDSVPALKAAPQTPEARAAGQAAFAKAGCGACHQGAQLVGPPTDVGTNGVFKAPSLIGLHARTNLMHSGCAPTLEARFDGTSCGGTRHGDVAALTAPERDRLMAYLRSL